MRLMSASSPTSSAAPPKAPPIGGDPPRLCPFESGELPRVELPRDPGFDPETIVNKNFSLNQLKLQPSPPGGT